MSPCVECRKVRSSAWPTSCATTRPSRRPWAMSSVIASPESASPRWRRHDQARARRRHEDAPRPSGEQRDAERVPILGVVLPQFAIVEDDRQRHVRVTVAVALPGHVDAFAAPDVTQLLRHGVPGHAADRVLHDRLEPDPDRRALEGLGAGPEAAGEQMEGSGKQEASERACRHGTVFRLTKGSCLHSGQRPVGRYRTVTLLNTVVVPSGYRVPHSGDGLHAPTSSQTIRNGAPLAGGV